MTLILLATVGYTAYTATGAVIKKVATHTDIKELTAMLND